MKELLRRTKDYIKRYHLYYLCGIITLALLAFGLFRFPNAVGRLVESVRDVGTSIAYYVCELFEIRHGITPTVNAAPDYSFLNIADWLPFIKKIIPSTTFPETFEEFQANWAVYWEIWASAENVEAYLYALSDILYYVSKIILLLLPLFLALWILLQRNFEKQNNDYDKDSKPLQVWKRFTLRVCTPVKMWFLSFFGFIRDHKRLWQFWMFLLLLYFNGLTIIIEFIAFYLYFVVSFDVGRIYPQIYKLFLDLWAILSFMPLWGWIIFALWVVNKWRRKVGYSVLEHNEMKNRGFTNARPIVSMIVATMGKGKTTMMTCQGMSSVVMQRDKAFEKILENDLKFPYFPWINLENSIKRAMEKHVIYNLATTRRFIQKRAAYFENHRSRRNCFGYDYERYGYTYSDELKTVTVWEIIEIYAQLYFIYVIQSSTLLANYSVRLDDIMEDLGNFPLWNSDFFRKDSRLIDSYSRHAKILDFNALRLGFKLGEDRKFADSFEFGTILITEIGKERGNKVENAEKKKDSFMTNQKNDGFNSWLKMVRHSATVDGYPFVRVITDEQRPESWGADARNLCEIIHIREKEETRLAMPFFALEELLYQFLFNKFSKLYYDYRFIRSDNTLCMWLLKSAVSKIQHYYTGIYNTFGYHALQVEVERGTQDGTVQTGKYYISNKKVYSKRFSTDAFSDFFTVKALRSPVGLDDMPEYKTERATFEELNQQNSYFVNDLLSGMNSDE